MNAIVMVPPRVPWLWAADPIVMHPQHDDLIEIYSQPRLTPAAQLRGLKADLACDLLTGWNLSCPARRIQLIQEIKGRQPTVIMMSPPCTYHCNLMAMNWFHMPVDEREQAFREHHSHVEFCMLVADMQMDAGRFFIFEHPRDAISHGAAPVRAIAQRSSSVTFDGCQVGFVDRDGKPTKKPFKIMTNINELVNLLETKVCPRNHRHTRFVGIAPGDAENRSKRSQIYPAPFISLLVESILAAKASLE